MLICRFEMILQSYISIQICIRVLQMFWIQIYLWSKVKLVRNVRRNVKTAVANKVRKAYIRIFSNSTILENMSTRVSSFPLWKIVQGIVEVQGC